MNSRLALISIFLASTLSAQISPGGFNCVLDSGSSPRAIRRESVADLVGDIAFFCPGTSSGGTPRPGVTVPTVNVTVTLNAPVTSRILGSNNAGTLIEALLMLDDPAPGSQFPCTAITCPFVIGQALGNGATENRNVYQGVLTSANTVTFPGVPMYDGGPSALPKFRIVNLRTSGSSVSPTAPFVDAIIGAAGFPFPARVADVFGPATYVQKDATGGTTGIPPVYPAATPQNPTVGATTTPSFQLVFSDAIGQFFSMFARRNPGTSEATPTTLAASNDPLFRTFTETGFYEPAFPVTNGLNIAGLATQGTRFEARFTGIPAGVNIYVGTSQDPLYGYGNPRSPRLVDLANGAIINPTVTIAGGLAMAQLTVTGGAATAVWELFGDAGFEGEAASFAFPIVVSYSGVPAASTVQVGASYGPVDTSASAAASSTLQVPRFRTGAPFTAFTITAPPVGPPVVTTTSVPNGQQGLNYGPVTLTATGGVAPLTWNVSAGALPTGVTLSTAGVLSGNPGANGTFNFTARVADVQGQSGTAALSMLIRPPVSISTTSVPDGQVGVTYTTTTLVAAGGLAPYSWSITSGAIPTGLTFTSGGVLSGLPSVSGTFNFVAQVTDSAGQSVTRNYTSVIRPRVSISTTSLPAGTVGVAYSANVIGSGGSLPYGFLVTSGALPGGLLMSSAGAITGSPLASGTFNFVTQITDGVVQTATANLSIVIGTPLSITNTSLPSGQVGTPYSASLAATGGTSPYTWSLLSGALPNALTLSPTTGAITGLPSVAGTFNFVVQVQDANRAVATRSLTIIIGNPLSITTTSLPTGQTGAAYSATLNATGGTPPYTFYLLSGNLPGGVTLSSAGLISGTPNAAGTFNFVAQVGDSASGTSSRNLSITIGPSLTITTTLLPDGQVGVPYSTTLNQSGGLAPFVWTISQGALPSGLVLASAGAITGTPQVGGLASLSVTVTDARGQSANVALSLNTRARVRVSSQVLPDAELNRPYSARLLAGGGLAPFRWSLGGVSSGPTFAAASSASRDASGPQAGATLPPGLVLDPAGFITGTPTASGYFDFTLTVTDATGQQASSDVQMQVSSSSFTIPTFSLPSGAVECRFNNRLQANGGAPPYTWTAIGLPEGLSLSTTGEITGQPRSDGAFLATIIVTDSNGQVVRQELRFNVAPALTIISPESIDPVGTDQPIPIAFAASGGTPPYAFSLESGSLPPGLSLDAQGLLVGTTSTAGTFGISVKVSDACGVTARRSYPVRVVPSRLAECSLTPQPQTLKFTVQQGTGAVSQSVGLAARCATPLALSVQAEQSAGAPWLSATPGSVTTSIQGGSSITVTANPGSLPVGTYTGSIGISGTLGASVPVVMSVVSAPVTLQVSPVGLTFTALQNGPNPAPQNLSIVALPRGPMSWSASGSTLSGGQWFSLSTSGGATDTGQPGLSTLSVQVSPAGLAPGEYYGTIEVNASGANNSSKSITVVMNVLPAGQSNVPTPDQTGFIFTGSAARTVVITNPSTNMLTFSTSRHSIEGPIWFSVDPASGTLAPGGKLSMRITPDPAWLTRPGVRRSLLTVRFSDGNFINIEVVQVVPLVSPTPASADDGKSGGGGGAARAVAGCTPTRLVGVFTTLQQNFSVPVGWPTGIDMEIVDDCAEPLAQGYSTIGFSCCDSPKAMIPLRGGRLSATWVARAPANTEVAVTADYANESKSLKGTHSVSGVIARTGNPPIIASGGAVSGATFGLGQPLAPGILTSVFGERLADQTAQAQSLPLSTTLGATSASLGGKLLPLFFTSDGQVNSQAPFDLPTNTELSLIVRRGASLSAPETVTIAAAAPGMFTRNQSGTGQAAVVDVLGRVIEPGNAIGAGGIAILFATGLGEVDRLVQPGSPAPGVEPLARTVSPVEVKVGGVPAQVFYAGLAPGFVGLYQINFAIPNGVTPGDAVTLTIATRGATSTPGTLAIK